MTRCVLLLRLHRLLPLRRGWCRLWLYVQRICGGRRSRNVGSWRYLRRSISRCVFCLARLARPPAPSVNIARRLGGGICYTAPPRGPRPARAAVAERAAARVEASTGYVSVRSEACRNSYHSFLTIYNTIHYSSSSSSSSVRKKLYDSVMFDTLFKDGSSKNLGSITKSTGMSTSSPACSLCSSKQKHWIFTK